MTYVGSAFGGFGGGISDPNWSDVLLLLNGSATVTTDSSSYNRTLYASRDILDATQPLFGLPTYKLAYTWTDRVYSYLSGFMAAELNSGEWCIEYFVRPNDQSLGTNHQFSLLSRFSFRWLPTKNFRATCSVGGTSITVTQSDNNAPQHVWYHVALVRDNTTNPTFSGLRLFVDGVEKASDYTVAKSSAIGADTDYEYFIGVSSSNMSGHVTQMRITKNTARYYADFTPPTASFPTS